MSNYTLTAFQPTEEVTVGWDRILRSYFLHVVDTTVGEDKPGRDLLWIGCTLDEIHDVEIIIKAVMAHAVIPYDVIHNLYLDPARVDYQS